MTTDMEALQKVRDELAVLIEKADLKASPGDYVRWAVGLVDDRMGVKLEEFEPSSEVFDELGDIVAIADENGDLPTEVATIIILALSCSVLARNAQD